MKDFFWLLSFYFTQQKNRVLNPTKDSLIKSGLVLLFAGFFFPVVYQLFYFIFKHFYSVPIIGPLLVNRLLYAFFLTFSVMILLSSVISAIPVLYLSRDMDFLFGAPLRPDAVFTMQAVKILTGASWMIFMMSLPVFGAYCAVLKLDFSQFVFIIIAHAPFFITLASAGILLTLLLIRFFPAENVRNVAVALSGIFAAALIIYFRMLQPEKLSGSGFAQVTDLLNSLRAPEYPWLPHSQLVLTVISTASSGIIAALPRFLGFLSVSLAIFAVTISASNSLYFEGYGTKGSHSKQKPPANEPRYYERPVFLAQLIKDLKYLLRDTSQWIQVVFLMGIVFIYLFNLYKLPAELYGLKDFIFFLNIGFIGLVLSAVGARFVLPVISTEGKGFWIFRSSPVGMKEYMLYKLVAYGALMVLIGQIVATVSVYILKPGGFVAGLTYFSTFFITAVIASAGLGLGGYFANFNIRNPEELMTGSTNLAPTAESTSPIKPILRKKMKSLRP